MIDYERILLAYEAALGRMTAEVAEELQPSPEERHHLGLLDELIRSLVRAYGAHHLRESSSLDTSTSVMYAIAQSPDRILDVPLRSLVDAGSLSVAQARLLNQLLGAKRSLLLTGAAKAGKSTLLNAVVQLIPIDERIVAVERGEELPGLANRSFSVRLTAGETDPSLDQALQKAAAMRPDWVVAGPVRPADLSGFLRMQKDHLCALASLEASGPEEALREWAADDRDRIGEIERVGPVVVHMERDRLGLPRLTRIVQVSAAEGSLLLRGARRGAASAVAILHFRFGRSCHCRDARGLVRYAVP